MRFSRGFRVTAYEPTSRKLAAVKRRQRLDREKFPLFADEIAEGQTDPEQVLIDRAIHWVERQQARRDYLAQQWREARAQLRALPDDRRAAFVRYWNRSKYPGDAGYLKSALLMFERGDLMLHEGEVHSRSNLEWERATRAKFAAMTDGELDHMIQTHISPLFAEWGRQERQRRFADRAATQPAQPARSPRSRRR